MTAFRHELRVRYAECDAQAIVFNAHYLTYADVAFTEFWREAIGPWDGMLSLGVDAVVAEANLRFRSPARFDDVLALEVALARLGETSTTTEIAVRRGDEDLVTIVLRHVCVSRETWTPVPWPDEIRSGLERFAPAAPVS